MSNNNVFAIATRRSPLALAQAHMVQAMVAAALGEAETAAEMVAPIRDYVSSGDRNLAGSLAEIGGKGLFTKEIEDALLSGNARFAVHSMKDMPAISPPGLVTAAIPRREDPRDVFLSPTSDSPWNLPQGAKIGTASVRRLAQTLGRRPDLKPVTLRGNVGTRLDKLDRGDADGTFLALAGLRRLGLERHATYIMPPEEMLPAVGQGALCVQAREDDDEALAIAARFNCPETEICVAVERAFLAGLDGSCRTPIAGLATITGGEVHFRGELLSLDGQERFTTERNFPYTANGIEEAASHGAESATEIRDRAGNAFFDALGGSAG
ncbi:hydroxymethylbilane synthase [Hyphococcus sp. DH-69]|uniref:hydroxymethylbilane synthase n=1 Tax=Hyphococcus formosus TaxID=3143534 RepID=UPI00398A7086